MDPVEALSSRMPDRAELIGRCYWADARFRSICEDYRDACAVLERLERRTPPEPEAVRDYRVLVAELLDEAMDALANAR